MKDLLSPFFILYLFPCLLHQFQWGMPTANLQIQNVQLINMLWQQFGDAETVNVKVEVLKFFVMLK